MQFVQKYAFCKKRINILQKYAYCTKYLTEFKAIVSVAILQNRCSTRYSKENDLIFHIHLRIVSTAAFSCVFCEIKKADTIEKINLDSALVCPFKKHFPL